MKKSLRDMLEDWPRNFIRDADLTELLDKSDDARYSMVKRALKAGHLVRMRKGFYLVTYKTKQILPDEFELASLMYEPSIISRESALSYHCWIPEAVYVTTCVTPKRAQEFETPLGTFNYKHVPLQGFFMGVKRVTSNTGVFLIAEPWRALADFIYTRRRSWDNLSQLEADLRIDVWTTMESDQQLLKELSENYPSPRVRKQLKIFLQEIIKNS